MKRTFVIIYSIILLLSHNAFALSYNEDDYIFGDDTYLSEKEERALNIAYKWKDGDRTTIEPAEGENGTVLFIYGVEQPSIVCAITQVCDIALEAGEVIQKDGLHIGDPARWSVMPAMSGLGAKRKTHLIIKPRGSIGNTTTLFVATDRRTYHIRLLSHRKEYMPRVAFQYPENEKAAWNVYQAQASQHIEKLVIPETQENIAHLDFEYSIKGKTRWKPVRVYNDGIKTIIQLPATAHQTEVPTLLIIDRTDEEQIVNYRLRDNRYIVDQIFEKAILITGVGGNQQKVTITKKPL